MKAIKTIFLISLLPFMAMKLYAQTDENTVKAFELLRTKAEGLVSKKVDSSLILADQLMQMANALM